jgi:hypothetical protein
MGLLNSMRIRTTLDSLISRNQTAIARVVQYPLSQEQAHDAGDNYEQERRNIVRIARSLERCNALSTGQRCTFVYEKTRKDLARFLKTLQGLNGH